MLCRFQSEPPPLIIVPGNIETFFSARYRKGDIFTNGDLFYNYKHLLQKDNFYSVFRASPVSISQNNPYAKKGIFWGGIFCYISGGKKDN